MKPMLSTALAVILALLLLSTLEIEDLKDIDPKRFGVMPQTDPRTGLVVGGKNPTSLIMGLKEINGRTIADLEADMRPDPKGFWGVTSVAGFLGPEEKLLEVLAEDNRYVVEELGLTHQQLARPLHVMGAVASSGPKQFLYHGRRFEVTCRSSKGLQLSPFYDDTKTDSDAIVKNLDNGKKMQYSLLVPHMIDRYGFYEGKGTPYRVDPRQVVEVFDFLKDLSAVEANAARQTRIWWTIRLAVWFLACGVALLWLRGKRPRKILN